MKLLRTTLAALLMLCYTTISAYNFSVDGIYYEILSDTEVEVTSGDEKYSGGIKIPASVTYEGATYSVTTIDDWAFFGCTELTSLTIGNSVTTIESGVFYGCEGLTNITSLIPAEKLFVPGSGAFSRCNNNNCVLYVPAGAKETYAATEGWKDFTNIVELPSTAIEKTTIDTKSENAYYDLNGRRVENPTRGIYIKNGQKILVK